MYLEHDALFNHHNCLYYLLYETETKFIFSGEGGGSVEIKQMSIHFFNYDKLCN